MSTGALFAFSGVDCAGKTTQIERATASLGSLGLRSTVFWLRPGYSRELNAVRSFVRRVRPGTIPAPGASSDSARGRAFARPEVRMAWVATAIADLGVQYTVKLRALLAANDVVLCDRSLLDAALDLELRFPELAPWWRPAIAGIEAVAPRTDAHFLLILPHAEVLHRAATKAEPFPDSDAVRDARFQAYVAASTDPTRGLTVVDSDHPVDEVANAIGGHITTCLERRRGRP